jgi:hypothetical protein
MGRVAKPYNRRDRWRRAAFIAVLVVALDACSPNAAPSSAPSAAPVVRSSAAASSAPTIITPSDPAGWTRYKSAGFSIATPPGWKTNSAYDYSELGPGQDIHGVSFTIPAALAKGTNLSSGSYISVETLPGSKTCAASAFIDSPTAEPSVSENGVTYSVATGSQGAAGNFYEETVYAANGTSPCIAVRYFIHSTNIGNYDPGTIKAFDKPALIARLDAIRRTLVLNGAK